MRPFFSYNDTAPTDIYTLSLHDALPISKAYADGARHGAPQATQVADRFHLLQNLAETLTQIFNRHSEDRKSTRLNSSHLGISYAVFCLKKKKKKNINKFEYRKRNLHHRT